MTVVGRCDVFMLVAMYDDVQPLMMHPTAVHAVMKVQ